jgi:hypothetical protein
MEVSADFLVRMPIIGTHSNATTRLVKDSKTMLYSLNKTSAISNS